MTLDRGMDHGGDLSVTTRIEGQSAAAVDRRPVPGDGLLHPLAVAAVALLVVNDHILKAIAPGPLTGKLSDVAGLLFFPLFIVAAGEVIAAALGRWHGPDRTAVSIAVVVTGLGFAAVKLHPVAEAAYEVALGVLQWPMRALADVAAGMSPWPPVAVDIVRDPTDLVAIAAAAIAWRLGTRRAARRDQGA
jgi:hypothetical protein